MDFFGVMQMPAVSFIGFVNNHSIHHRGQLAASLRAIGGQIQGRLLFRNDDERARAKKWGITDLNRKYSMLEMAKGDVMFAATGVTSGSMLKGVRRFGNGAETHSIVMRSKTGTIRTINASHQFHKLRTLSPLEY